MLYDYGRIERAGRYGGARIYIPSAIISDSQFPLKMGSDIWIKVDPSSQSLVIRHSPYDVGQEIPSSYLPEIVKIILEHSRRSEEDFRPGLIHEPAKVNTEMLDIETSSERQTLVLALAGEIARFCRKAKISLDDKRNRIAVANEEYPIFASALADYLDWPLLRVWTQPDPLYRVRIGHVSGDAAPGSRAFVVNMQAFGGITTCAVIDFLRREPCPRDLPEDAPISRHVTACNCASCSSRPALEVAGVFTVVNRHEEGMRRAQDRGLPFVTILETNDTQIQNMMKQILGFEGEKEPD